MNLSAIRVNVVKVWQSTLLLLLLFAVAAIGAFRYFGQTARQQAAAAAAEVAGGDGSNQTKNAGEAAKNATDQADKNKINGYL